MKPRPKPTTNLSHEQITNLIIDELRKHQWHTDIRHVKGAPAVPKPKPYNPSESFKILGAGIGSPSGSFTTVGAPYVIIQLSPSAQIVIYKPQLEKLINKDKLIKSGFRGFFECMIAKEQTRRLYTNSGQFTFREQELWRSYKKPLDKLIKTLYENQIEIITSKVKQLS